MQMFYMRKPTTHIAGFSFLLTCLSNQCVFLQGKQPILEKLVRWGVSIKIYLSATVHHLNQGLCFMRNTIILQTYWLINNYIIEVILIFI